MRLSVLLFTTTAWSAQLMAVTADDATDALINCANCLSSNSGDSDCTDECNLDDAIHQCCDWWSCGSCPSTTTTTFKLPPPRKTTTTKPHRRTTTTTKRRTTTTQTEPQDIVVVVYQDEDCKGESATLTLKDFTGGNGDSKWDACNGQFDDGTDISYQKDIGTWLRSLRVSEGYTIATSTQCRDDFNYADDTNVKDIVTAASGCVTTSYDFNQVDFNPVSFVFLST